MLLHRLKAEDIQGYFTAYQEVLVKEGGYFPRSSRKQMIQGLGEVCFYISYELRPTQESKQ